jgi:hypothetical protein
VHDSVRILPFLSEAKRGGLKDKNEMCAIRLTTQERDFLMDVWQHPTSSRSLKKRPRLSISKYWFASGREPPKKTSFKDRPFFHTAVDFSIRGGYQTL